jgi:reactive intermediate/imine deaminase
MRKEASVMIRKRKGGRECLMYRGHIDRGDVVVPRCCSATFYTRELFVTKHPIQTAHAPRAIGTYSQAIEAGGVVYLSGQIGLDPASMEMADGFEAQAHQVFANMRAVVTAAGGNLENVAKLTVFLSDLAHFARLNEIMSSYFTEPYPARSAVGVSQLPRDAMIEIDAIVVK